MTGPTQTIVPSSSSVRTTSSSTRYTRHYYSQEKLFEKSLDIYDPVRISAPDKAADRRSRSSSSSLPMVVLVVGSGWLGHYPFVYKPTSWWNSSGPETVASLGYTCVCVRHRGAFPRVPKRVVVSVAVLGVLLALAILFLLGGGGLQCFTTIVFTTILTMLLNAMGQGSAHFSGMLEDVTEALVWLRERHPMMTTGQQQGQQEKSRRPVTIIFGGYSSGAHVASTLLQQPEILKSKGLPHPEKLFHAILFISGVLAVRPPKDDSITASLVEKDCSSSPRWFTDFVMNVVWEDSRKIPSPLQSTPPRIPHLLIGCQNELFGLNWLDIFFCSKTFCKKVRALGVPAKWVAVRSDHWNILHSRALSEALEGNLKWVLTHASKSAQQRAA